MKALNTVSSSGNKVWETKKKPSQVLEMPFWVVQRRGITVKQAETFLVLPCAALTLRKIKQVNVPMQLP